MSFSFVGRLPSSKSLMNRALIVQSYFPEMQIVGESDADDVVLMKEALVSLGAGRDIECGHAGTVLRFMALRAAREKGEHTLVGSERLFSRPQEELAGLLGQLSCEVKFESSRMKIKSWGYKPQGDMLYVKSERSSQFASGLLLNAWKLERPVFVVLRGMATPSYFSMTRSVVEYLGMKVEGLGPELQLLKGQVVNKSGLIIEPDLSSAFSLAACAVVDGHASITNFPRTSLQPDRIFVEHLQSMGAEIKMHDDTITFEKTAKLKPLRADLKNQPDLFPVLAALCALADGTSVLSGAEQLQFKESNRLEKVRDLLSLCGVVTRPIAGGLEIVGQGLLTPRVPKTYGLPFDVDQDHRMAMAAAVMMKAGYALNVNEREVVNKSFPGFWDVIGETL